MQNICIKVLENFRREAMLKDDFILECYIRDMLTDEEMLCIIEKLNTTSIINEYKKLVMF